MIKNNKKNNDIRPLDFFLNESNNVSPKLKIM